MYDNIRSKDFNPKNCSHLACSEIRAANMGGYCNDSFSYFNKSKTNAARNSDCVRSKAFEHLAQYYDHCTDNAMSYINASWDKCYADCGPLKDFSREKQFLKL
jgi:inner membrane protease ATP23